MLKKIPLIILPVLTSVLLVLAYPKFDLGWLGWAGLGPLCYYLLAVKSPRAAALGGLAGGWLFYAGILYWIYPTMRAGGVGAGVSALGLLLLSLVLALEFALISVYGYFLRRAGFKVWPYLFALGWFLLEYGKVWLSFKAVWFPWFMLGYTQWQCLPLIQAASVTGVYGLGAAMAFGCALGASLFFLPGPAWKKALRFSPALLLLGGLWIFGRAELAGSGTPVRHLDVALLQPSIDQYAKWDATREGEIKQVMAGLAARSAGAELAVWPENALPCWLDEAACYDWLRGAAAPRAGASLVGSVSKGDGSHVSAFLLDGAGTITASYDKRQLVPFGEYVPLRSFLGRYIKPVAELGEFLPGSARQGLLQLRGFKLGVSICYEAIFPTLFARDAAAGADLFVNLTNDGWYLDTAAPRQHFIASIFRAVETRRSVVRAANNGISGVIDPWGRVLARTALNERLVLEAAAPVYPVNSFFVVYGHWFAMAALMVVAAFLIAVIFA
ncbi:MAG: apolipoprotein N-acyltransferase [Elusimicrobiales bacterium]|nr:apolipoprotein N-acyltransferase [Elusimicrobiales bacterium]